MKDITEVSFTIWQFWLQRSLFTFKFHLALTGLNKAETAEKHGEEQVKIWRRSFDIPPPAMEKDHPYYENIVKDPRYADGPSADEFPMFESLKLTIERTLPYWNNTIVPQVIDCLKSTL